MPNRPADDPKKKRFAQEYVVDFNAKAAAIRCGVPPKAAKVTGCRWLQRTEVFEEVELLLDAQAAETKVTARDVLVELARLAFIDTTVAGKVKSYADLRKLPPAVRRAIQGYKFKNGKISELKFASKVDSLQLLGKHLKLFLERIGIGDPNGNPLPPAAQVNLSKLSDEQLLAIVEKLG